MVCKPRGWSLLSVVLVLALLLPAAPAASAPAAPPDPLAQLTLETGGTLRVGYSRATGQVNFLAMTSGRPWQAAGLATLAAPAARAESAARQFLTSYGALFGLDAQSGLSVLRNIHRADGRTYVRFQQQLAGVPVFAGELIVQLDAAQSVELVIGEAQPRLSLSTVPTLSAAAAQTAALAATANVHGVAAGTLQASPAALWVYNPSLTEPQAGPVRLVWRVEVTPLDLGPLRELVLVDAARGSVALQFNQTDTALSRLTYTASSGTSLPGSLLCNTADTTCTGAGTDTHAVKAHVYAGDTYNFFFSRFARDSIDGAGLTLLSTVHYGIDYENAFWNGDQMVYGDGFGFPLADDVVAHELTHGVTQYESNLFYYYQSGAINEALSDVFGEFMDLTNASGSDSASDRWKLGEDIGNLGAIRNMQDPTLFNDPDKMTSAFFKSVSGDVTNPSFDNGGVHTNSGLLNKATYLLTDGASFNGITVSAIGLTKTAQIVYHTAANLLTSGSDYLDLYNALNSSCTTLIGQFGIGAGDCQEVRDATDATEMNLQPVPNFNTDAALCPGAETVATELFNDGLEANASNWTFSALTGSSRWSRDDIYAHGGQYSLIANDFPAATSDSVAAMNVSVPLTTGAYLHFDHAYGFDGTGPDGGIVEYSTNAGASWTNAGSLFLVNGYNGVINAGPLSGSGGFVGDSHGYISSRLSLTELAGQSVRFRFRMSNNAFGADVGWAVDDVHIYTCSGVPGTFSKIHLPLVGRNLSGTGTWQDIVNEGFEGAWPSTGWTVTDPGYDQYFWGKRSCRAATGSFSAWAMGAGSLGAGLGCSANYINYGYSWMIYGPFSLADATQAELRLRLWLNAEYGYDDVCQFASTDNAHYYGTCITGTTGGAFAPDPIVLDLTDVYTLGNLAGQGSVWIAVVFRSDQTETQPEGAHVDDLVLRKCAGGCATASANALTSLGSQLVSYPAALNAPTNLVPGQR
jgi:bacillolysin